MGMNCVTYANTFTSGLTLYDMDIKYGRERERMREGKAKGEREEEREGEREGGKR